MAHGTSYIALATTSQDYNQSNDSTRGDKYYKSSICHGLEEQDCLCEVNKPTE